MTFPPLVAIDEMSHPATAGSLVLPLARYRFSAAFGSDLVLPEYAGSLLRGVFGAALRRSACMTGLPDCKTCPLWRTCPYPAIFETPPRETQLAQRFSQVPNPYVIEPPLHTPRRWPAGEPLSWSMVLVGDEALGQLPMIVHAWQRSLRHGWGKESVRAHGELLAVEKLDADFVGEPVWDAASSQIIAHQAQWSWTSTQGSRLAAIEIQTPLRLQQEGHPLGAHELSPRTLVAHLLRRVRLMLELHLGITRAPFDVPALIAHAASLTDDRSGLRWRDWIRYSSRQKQEMTLGGVVGLWRLQGELDHLLPWFHLGQWLHLGKNATMGMGKYTLSVDGAPQHTQHGNPA
jgi:hypothetical protein